jgi:hypothetical protein
MALARQAKKLNDNLGGLQNKGDVLTRWIVEEKKRNADLTAAIHKAEIEITRFQKDVQQSAVDVLNLHSFSDKEMTTADGWNPSLQGIQSQKKMCAILENRLNKVLSRLSTYEHENSQIKIEINELRRRRQGCNLNRRQLEKKLKVRQEKVKVMLEQSASTSVVQSRAIEAQGKVLAENAEELKVFEESYGKLGIYIQDQLKVFEESIQDAAKEVQQQLATGEGPPEEQRGALSISQEAAIKARMLELAEEIDQMRQSARDTEMRAAKLKIDFEGLKIAAKNAAISSGMAPALAEKQCSTVEGMTSFYLTSTNETFSLFKFNLDVIQETEAVIEKTEEVQKEHVDYEEHMTTEDAARAATIGNINEDVTNIKQQIVEYVNTAQEAQRTIELLAKKVQSLFYKIQCDQVQGGGKGGPGAPKKNAKSQLLLAGGSGSVNESNILAFMELIEERAVELTHDYVKKSNFRGSIGPGAGISPSKNETGSTFLTSMNIPDARVEVDEEELDEKPLPLEILRQRTAESHIKSQNLTGGMPMLGASTKGGQLVSSKSGKKKISSR